MSGNDEKVVIQTFSAPSLKVSDLKKAGKKKEFLSDYRSYVRKCENSAGTAAHCSLLSCFDHDLLERLLSSYALRDAEGKAIMNKDGITEAILEEFLDPKLSKEITITKPQLQGFLSNVKWQKNVTFVEAVSLLVGDIYTALDEAGWKEAFTEEQRLNPKWLTTSMLSKISHAHFAEELEAALAANGEEAKKSWKKAVDRAFELAKRFDLWTKNDGTTRASGKEQSKKKDQKESSATKTGGKRDREAPYCLNKDTCWGERHFVKDCPKTPEAKKKELLEAFKAKKKRTVKPRVNFLRKRLADSCTKFLIQGMLVEAEADTGSPVTICPSRLVKQLRSRGVHLKECKLEHPRSYAMAGGEAELRVTSEVTIPTLTLKAQGTIIDLKNVRLYVSEEVKTMLLGRAILQELGFDFTQFLTRQAHTLHGKDCQLLSPDEELQGEQGRAVSHLYEASTLKQEEDEGMPYLQVPPELAQQEREFQDMLVRTKEQMSEVPELYERLERVLLEHRDVFCSDYSETPAKVPPMHLKLKEGISPTQTPVRRYKPSQREFMDKTIDKLVQKKILRPVEEAAWWSAPHMVPKADTWRFTVDLRAVNLATMPEVHNKGTLEDEVAKLAGARFFSSLDMAHCFWQMPLEESAQLYHAIVAPTGLYAPTRVLHGAKNASIYTERVLTAAFAKISNNLATYLDDHLVFGKDENAWLAALTHYLKICKSRNILVSAKKAQLFAREVSWCGRRITKEGVTYESRNFQALQDMPMPTNAAELQQLLCAVNWMRLAIPAYEELVRPLHELLLRKSRKAASSKASVLRAYPILGDDLTEEVLDSFAQVKNRIRNRVQLAHFDPEKKDAVLCLSTDASQEGWAGVLTKISREDLEKPMLQQRHEPVAFASGKFNTTQKNWSTIEQEAYSVLTSMERFRCWTLYTTTRVCTDSKVLNYIWKPIPEAVANRLGLSSIAVSKLARWALRLSAFDYEIEHIAGADNHFPDLLSRWGTRRKINFIKATSQDRFDRNKFSERIFEEVRQAQRTFGSKRRKGSKTMTYAVPPEAKELITRIMTMAHGAAEHRNLKNTLSSVRDLFTWPKLEEDVKTFVDGCILCQKTRRGERVPRPLGNLLHAEKPNELLHFDFLYLSEEGRFSYLLVLKDDFSGLCLLHPSRSADTEAVVQALQLWIGLFGVPKFFHSDTASHFKNHVMKRLALRLQIEHSFAVAYAPWSNGSVERLMRSVLEVFRRICAKEGRAYKEWHLYVSAVQRVLNTRPTRRLQEKSPAQVFTNAEDQAKNLSILLEEMQEPRVVDVDKEFSSIIDTMQESWEAFHKGLNQQFSKERKRQIERHNAKTNIQEQNFEVGDYVLVGLPDAKKSHKLSLRWQGPARVVELSDSDLVFGVQFLNQEKVSFIHASRLLHYADGKLGLPAEVLEHVEQEAVDYFVVDKILDVRSTEDGEDYEVLIKWQGYDEETWEPFSEMAKDCEELMEGFVTSMKDKKLKKILSRRFR